MSCAFGAGDAVAILYATRKWCRAGSEGDGDFEMVEAKLVCRISCDKVCVGCAR